MAQDSKNHRSGHLFRLPPRWRLISWPVVTLSGGGSVAALWLQKEAILLMDFAPIAAIPGLAALLYWFNHQLFKTSMPRPDDLKTPPNPNKQHGKKE